MRELPSEGNVYRNREGFFYRVICIARDSDTLEEVVVYENRDDSSKKYVRPLSKFITEVEQLNDSEDVPDELISFLDARGPEEKLEVLMKIRGRLTDDIIRAIAISLDTEVRDGSVEEKYEEIKAYLSTTIRYEGARLRK